MSGAPANPIPSKDYLVEAVARTIHERADCACAEDGRLHVCVFCEDIARAVMDTVDDLAGHALSPTYEKMCRSKQRYKTKGKALNAAIRYAKLGPQRAYKCPFCPGWHLTSKRAFR